MYPQFTACVVSKSFTIKRSKGRPIIGKLGDIFLITNPKYDQKEYIKVDRKTKATINSGYIFTISQFHEFLSVLLE